MPNSRHHVDILLLGRLVIPRGYDIWCSGCDRDSTWFGLDLSLAKLLLVGCALRCARRCWGGIGADEGGIDTVRA